MSKNAQRASQIVSNFGPGAMIDLPTRSVVVGGLELWEMRGDAFTTIPEPRLTLRLEQLLKQQDRLAQTKSLSLRTPPISDSRPGRLPSYIVAPVFPAYFVCERVESITVDGKPIRRRRLVRWQDLDPRGGRRRFIFDDGKKSDVTPIRFVCACKEGHLQEADDEVFARLKRIREGAAADSGRSAKVSEFDVFASGRPEIGQNYPSAKLYAQTLPRELWADPSAGVDLSLIKNLVAVHRLREVSCLYGFTRFEAAPTSADGELEDVQLAVRGAPITQNADWLPAIEQFGEGVFIHFDETAIRQWLGSAA